MGFRLTLLTMPIDPIISLAFAMQSNKGVYALLLGSGVSRSAGVFVLVVERGGLENRCALARTVGSNPTPSANISTT